MSPWQNERWACAPTNDGRNFAPAHRWAVVEARPLCFGLLRSRYGVQVVSSEPCWCGKCAHVIACIEAGDEVEDASADYAALARSCIREAHELRQRIATLEAENAALRRIITPLNVVTARHRHGQPVEAHHLTALASRQIEVEQAVREARGDA